MSRQVATAYTSANVSLTIGGTLLTNVFGISYELSQNKRPIYGYNSMHWNAVAKGQILVMGQLFVNFQHPNFLSAVIQKYYAEKNAGIETDINLNKSSYAREADNLALVTAYNSNARISQDLLNAIYNDPNLSANPGKMFSRGKYFSGQSGDDLIISPMSSGQKANVVSRNLLSDEKRKRSARYARPDQFSGQGGLKDQLDIIITYGDPNLTGNSELSGIVPYMPSSSIVLRDVHFLGESQQVMADDQPIMEVYKFIARKKETLIPTKDSRIVISAKASASAPAVPATGDAAASDGGAVPDANAPKGGAATDVTPTPDAAVDPTASATEEAKGSGTAAPEPEPAAEPKPKPATSSAPRRSTTPAAASAEISKLESEIDGIQGIPENYAKIIELGNRRSRLNPPITAGTVAGVDFFVMNCMIGAGKYDEASAYANRLVARERSLNGGQASQAYLQMQVAIRNRIRKEIEKGRPKGQ